MKVHDPPISRGGPPPPSVYTPQGALRTEREHGDPVFGTHEGAECAFFAGPGGDRWGSAKGSHKSSPDEGGLGLAIQGHSRGAEACRKEKTGMFFNDEHDFENVLTKFLDNLKNYTPRDYFINNHGPKYEGKEIIKFIKKNIPDYKSKVNLDLDKIEFLRPTV